MILEYLLYVLIYLAGSVLSFGKMTGLDASLYREYPVSNVVPWWKGSTLERTSGYTAVILSWVGLFFLSILATGTGNFKNWFRFRYDRVS